MGDIITESENITKVIEIIRKNQIENFRDKVFNQWNNNKKIHLRAFTVEQTK